MSWQHVTATNRFVCTGEFLWKSLSLQQNFVTATCRKKSNQTEFVRLLALIKFCCRDKDFTKFLQYTRSDLSPQHVASTSCQTCTHGVICRRDWLLQLSTSVYRPLYDAFSSSLQRYVCPRDERLVHWIKDELWGRHYNLHVKCLAIQKDPDGVQWFHHSYWQCKQ